METAMDNKRRRPGDITTKVFGITLSRFIFIIVFTISTTISLLAWKASIVKKLENKDVVVEIRLAVIESKIDDITLTLEEIKKDIRRKK